MITLLTPSSKSLESPTTLFHVQRGIKETRSNESLRRLARISQCNTLQSPSSSLVFTYIISIFARSLIHRRFFESIRYSAFVVESRKHRGKRHGPFPIPSVTRVVTRANVSCFFIPFTLRLAPKSRVYPGESLSGVGPREGLKFFSPNSISRSHRYRRGKRANYQVMKREKNGRGQRRGNLFRRNDGIEFSSETTLVSRDMHYSWPRRVSTVRPTVAKQS